MSDPAVPAQAAPHTSRPRLRGVMHLWAALAALVAGPALCLAAADRVGARAQLGCVVYAVPPLCLTNDEADLVARAMVAAVEAGLRA